MNSKELLIRLKRLEGEQDKLFKLIGQTNNRTTQYSCRKQIAKFDEGILDCITAIESAKQREARVPRHKHGNVKKKPDHIGNNSKEKRR